MEEKQEEYRVDMFCLQLAAIVKRVLADKDTTPTREASDAGND